MVWRLAPLSNEFLFITIPYLGIIIVSDLGFAYAAYLSLSVWRGLSVPVYKSRALWTGILALIIAIVTPISGNVNVIFPSQYYVVGLILVYAILYPGAILGLFAWIDRTINTLIRLDYLRRDLTRWSKVRWVYWALTGIQLALYFGIVAFPQGPAILYNTYPIFLLAPAAYGTIALLIGSRRTKDMTFRLHAKWIGYLMGAIILISVVDSFTTNPALGNLPFLLIAFCFFKAARYLVPVGKFQGDQQMDRLAPA
jgi:hypothetical protein